MAKFSIISDASCDFNTELRERFGMDAVIFSQVMFPDGHSEQADPDWNNIDPNAYYGSMVDKKLRYQSSAPGIDNVKNVFRAELEKGNDIFCATLSSGMSAVYEQCCLARKELLEEYPERTIRVIDSKRYSTAAGLLCLYAAQLRSDGKSVDETADYIESKLDCIHQSGWMDDLFFLARAGRLSKGTAFMGTMIGVKPMADFNMDTGRFQVIGKARGVNKALAAVVEYLKATIEKPEDQIVFVAHSLRQEYAERLADRIREEVSPKEVITNWIGQSSGANIGPGLVAAFYFGKPLSKDLTEEAAVLRNILK